MKEPDLEGMSEFAKSLKEHKQTRTMEDLEQKIKSLDVILNQLREEWINAPTKDKWMEKINSALDTRLSLMSQRDSQEQE